MTDQEPFVALIHAQIAEVERQTFFLRHYTLPSQVQKRSVTQSRADQTLACLEAAAATLRMVRDGQLVPAPQAPAP